MKFPYGICDFREIITQGYFYCDRTGHIPLLERGKHLLFIRPRRFGKSMLLSMLFHYYDLAFANEFERLFGQLAIGPNPTSRHNHYLMLEWDFSCVEPFGDVAAIRKALHDHINVSIENFSRYYENYLKDTIRIDWSNAITSIQSLAAVAGKSGFPIYLLIDETDNFANQVMMGAQQDREKRYDALVFEEGPLRTLFKAVKSSTRHSLFDRIFITGVSPVVMSDITSGYNIAEDIFLDPQLNDLCGFTHEEVVQVVQAVAAAGNLKANQAAEALEMMQTYYDGYTFAPDTPKVMYNPTLVLYFLKALYQTGKSPEDLLDENLAMDQAKLLHIARIPGGQQLLLDIVHGDQPIAIKTLAKRFGMREMLSDRSKDRAFMVSLLYFLGVLTLSQRLPEGRQALKVPNLVIRKLYVERLTELLLPQPQVRDEGRLAAEQVYQKGDLAPLCRFVEQTCFRVFQNPDYRWANELTVKTAFLTLLYDDTLYIMDSEAAAGRRAADLTMIIRPDMRRYTILDILIEFKYVTLKEAGLSGQQAQQLTPAELQALPSMRRAMTRALEQVQHYGNTLEQRYGNLRLRRYVVVSLGFERLWWAEATK